ncbi:hypothetical protein BH10BAC1_BH10BAC1_05240 [soil metagenome]
MKKIFLAICISLAASSLVKAQTWDLVDDTGFGYSGLQISGLQSFKNNFYAACGHINTSGAFVFSSATGDNGTWNRSISYDGLMSGNEMNTSVINSTTANGGWILAGTRNYTDGPLVTKSFGGITWDSMPHIPYNNPIANYTEISAISFFNPSGADDTVFVSVQNGMDGAEIWKNYCSGGTWKKVFDFPSYTTGRINDMIKFNNKLYACTNTALIYESADGNNWTINIPADTGFNDANNYEFTAMTVFQNRLYVAAQNGTSGSQIWNTADGLTWNPVNVDGFTNGSNLFEITDMMSANGKLWISAYSWMTGGAIMPIGGEDRGAAYYTYIYSSSDGSTFTNLNNDGFASLNRFGSLGYFQNFIYQGSENTGWGPAAVWRMCQAPTPIITSSSTSACLFAPVYLSDTNSVANNYEWYVNGTLSSTSNNFTHIPVTAGVQIIKLIERNGTCADSTSFILTVNLNPTASATPFQTVCYGTTVTLMDTVSGGMAPYTFLWDTGSITYTTQTISIPALTGTSFTVTATDANGCIALSSSGYSSIPSTNIAGHVSYSGGNVTNGNAVLYRYIPSYTYFDTVMVAPLDGSGNYLFTAPISGTYLVKIFANTVAYPTLNSTYYGNEWAWDSAAVVTHGCSILDSANVVMIEELGIGGGPGMMTGTITEDVGFGSLIALGGGLRTPGDPIPGLDVKLGKNPGGAMVASGTTNGAGVYTFSGVPLNTGIEYYTVYVDIPGLGRDSSYNVTLTAANNQIYYLDYIVDSTTIYIVPNAGLGISNITVAEENKFGVYPNPTKGNATVEYSLLADAPVSLSVYNVLGVKVSEIVNSEQKAGTHKYSINSDDARLTAGVYFITLITDGKTSIQRLIITK